jgi:hypothetical protein
VRLVLRFAQYTLAIALSLSSFSGQIAFAQSAPASATHSPAQVEAALKTALAGANLTGKQKIDIEDLLKRYEAKSAGADPATVRDAQRSLAQGLSGVLTPAQQTAVKASLKQSLGPNYDMAKPS